MNEENAAGTENAPGGAREGAAPIPGDGGPAVAPEPDGAPPANGTPNGTPDSSTPDSSTPDSGAPQDGSALDEVREKSAQLLGHVSAMGAQLERISGDFVARFKSDDKLQTAFDRLYEEMTQYKDNFLFQAQKPLLVDMILLYDQVQNDLEGMEEGPARDAMDAVGEQLLEILYRRDVEPMDFDPDERFDREKMKAVSREATDVKEEDKQVVRLVRVGFGWNERVLRPHEVVVKRFKQA